MAWARVGERAKGQIAENKLGESEIAPTMGRSAVYLRVQSGISETRINQWRETRACRPPSVPFHAEVNRRGLQSPTTCDQCGQTPLGSSVPEKKHLCWAPRHDHWIRTPLYIH